MNPTTMIPSRNDDVTMACPVCATAITPSGRRRYCSDACRVAAHRRRHQPAPTPTIPPAGQRRAVTIYQCPTCQELALGEQRCDDCGTFMRRIGWGGECPHCFEPVAIDELLST